MFTTDISSIHTRIRFNVYVLECDILACVGYVLRKGTYRYKSFVVTYYKYHPE